jgi:hypothetical protein
MAVKAGVMGQGRNAGRGLLLMCFLLAACPATTEKGRSLPDALDEFNEAIVWKHFQVASSFVEAAAATSVLPRIQAAAANVEMVEVEPVSTALAPDGASAVCVVRFSWYSATDLTVRKGTEVQRWSRISGRWLLVGQEPPPDPKEPCSPFVDCPTAKKKN